MKLEAKVVQAEYEFADESGYRFRVVAIKDEEWGWEAAVTMAARGYRTPEDAVRHLTHSAKAFLRQVEESLGEES